MRNEKICHECVKQFCCYQKSKNKKITHAKNSRKPKKDEKKKARRCAQFALACAYGASPLLLPVLAPPLLLALHTFGKTTKTLKTNTQQNKAKMKSFEKNLSWWGRGSDEFFTAVIFFPIFILKHTHEQSASSSATSTRRFDCGGVRRSRLSLVACYGHRPCWSSGSVRRRSNTKEGWRRSSLRR